MKKPKIIIVDKDDNVIGTKYRDEIDYSKDIYRSTALWLTNSNNQVLIAQRKHTKDKDPSKWGPAVAGTVDEGETYESNIYKETEEEIGLTGVNLQAGPFSYMNSPRKQFIQWYTASVDMPIEAFKMQEEEVENIIWIDIDKLRKDVKENPNKYVPSFPKMLDLF